MSLGIFFFFLKKGVMGAGAYKQAQAQKSGLDWEE